LQVSNAPRKAAVDTDGLNWTIFQTGPFSEGLSFAIEEGSGLVRGQDLRQSDTVQQDLKQRVLKVHFNVLSASSGEAFGALITGRISLSMLKRFAALGFVSRR
jgi:hypothetical protein